MKSRHLTSLFLLSLGLFGFLFGPIYNFSSAAGSDTINPLTQWVSTTSPTTAITQRPYGTNLKITGHYWQFGTEPPLFTCQEETCLEIGGSDNSTAGTGINVYNTNTGTSAYTGITMSNDHASSNVTDYAGMWLNSCQYTDTTFGTGQATKCGQLFKNTMGPMSFFTSTTSATANYINFSTNCTSTTCERLRIINSGNVGIGIVAPTAQLHVVSPTGAASTDAVNALIVTGGQGGSSGKNGGGAVFNLGAGTGGGSPNGNGGAFTINAGAGGGGASVTGGNGSTLTVAAGTGGASAGAVTGGIGSSVAITLGNGGAGFGTSGGHAGAGGGLTITAGQGGTGGTGSTASNGGNGSAVQFLGGKGGTGGSSSSNGTAGVGSTFSIITGVGGTGAAGSGLNGGNAGASGALTISTAAGGAGGGSGAGNTNGGNGANAGLMSFISGAGGNGAAGAGSGSTGTGGNGANITFQTGAGGTGSTAGTRGIINFQNTAGSVGVGSSTPWAKFSINPIATDGAAPQFVVGSSTATNFIILNSGFVGIGTSSPTANFTVQGPSSSSATKGTCHRDKNANANSFTYWYFPTAGAAPVYSTIDCSGVGTTTIFND